MVLVTPTLLDLDFRRGGSLGLTRRHWTEEPTWASGEVRKIDVSLGLLPSPLVFHVRRFIPSDGDVLHRSWVGRDGDQRVTPLAPYAIADVAEARRYVEEYVRDNYDAVSAPVASGEAVDTVYREAREYYDKVRDAEAGVAKVGFKLMDLYFRVWFGIRCGMRSAWISGEETLDMLPVEDPAYPLPGRVSVPRQVVETVGCILEEVVRDDQHEFLQLLAKVFEGPERECFHAVFLLVFMMLHECEDISRDRYRYARENFKQTRFDQPAYVRRLHTNANILLGYWHEYARCQDVDWTSRETAEKTLVFLPGESRDVILRCYDATRHVGPNTLGDEGWMNAFWFCSQMMERDWAPRAGYDGDADNGFDAAAANSAWGRAN